MSTATMLIATKPYKVVTYNEKLLFIKSQDPFLTYF